MGSALYYPGTNVGRPQGLLNDDRPRRDTDHRHNPTWRELQGSSVLMRPRYSTHVYGNSVRQSAPCVMSDLCVLDGPYAGSIFKTMVFAAEARRYLELILATPGVHVAACTVDPVTLRPEDIRDEGVVMAAAAIAAEHGWDSPADEAKVLGQTIRSFRDASAMSQESLAQAVGLDQAAVSNIETGKRSVGALELRDIARAFDVSVTQLLP